jgi:predicted nucleic acid-binding protein
VIVVDASVWTAFLYPADVHHSSSRRWLDQWSANRGVILGPTLLLVEVSGAIARRTGLPAMGLQGIARIRRSPLVRLVAVDGRLAGEAADLAANLRLRGADAVYVALARREGVPLVTWDQEQLTRAQGVITTHTPDDVPTAP